MIVLDTHAWIWFIDNPKLLGADALGAIQKARKSSFIAISAISVWEIYMLHQRGRLRFAVEPDVWISRCERLSFLRFIPVDNEVSRISVQLPGTFHADPADRFIVATARFLGAPIVSKDRAIRSYSHVKVIW